MKPENVSTNQERIAKLARGNPPMAFTSLNHYLDYAVWKGIMERGGRRVRDVDVRNNFASISHAKLRGFLQDESRMLPRPAYLSRWRLVSETVRRRTGCANYARPGL